MRTKVIFFLSIVVFSALLVLVPKGFIPSDYGNTILTIATFLFGIFGGFCVAVTTTDYNTVRELASSETAAWISLYQTIMVYGENFAATLRPLIEHYIIRSFDYDFINYARETQGDFHVITDSLIALPVIDEKNSVHQSILDRMTDLVGARQELTALGKRSLSSLEWIVLVILAVIVIVTLYGLRTGNWFFDFVTVAVSSSTVLVLILIRDIDKYTWNESSFSFDVFNNVLSALGALPYYPAEFILGHVVKPKESKYRVGTLLKPGKSWERRIEIVDKT